jgi:hypothetical protein
MGLTMFRKLIYTVEPSPRRPGMYVIMVQDTRYTGKWELYPGRDMTAQEAASLKPADTD